MTIINELVELLDRRYQDPDIPHSERWPLPILNRPKSDRSRKGVAMIVKMSGVTVKIGPRRECEIDDCKSGGWMKLAARKVYTTRKSYRGVCEGCFQRACRTRNERNIAREEAMANDSNSR